MPLYEYLCDECGNNFEIKQSFNDNALVTCDQCKKDSLRRVFFPVMGFVHGGDNMTVGSLADKHNSQFSEDYKHELVMKSRAKDTQDCVLPKGMTPVERKEYQKPFWENEHCTATNKEVSKMTKEQKAKYVETGKKT